MRNRTNRLAPAVGLLFAALMLGACSSTSDFWDRSPRVAGSRQCAPPSRQYCKPAQPVPRARVAQPAPQPRETMPTPPRVVSPPAAAPAPQSTGDQERAVFARVNQVRAQHSLRALRFNQTLYNAARDHSLEQQRHGYMGHGSPDPMRARLGQRMQLAGYQGRVYAEVVAWGYTSPDAVVEGWLNSPDHRRILLDAELTEGAFSRAGQYWTGNFGAPRRFSTPAPGAPSRQPTARRAPTRTVPRAPARVPRRAPAPKPKRQRYVIVPQPDEGFG